MRQSFEPSIWGPHAWFFLETCAMGYPDNPTNEEQKYMKNFLISLKFVIPCEKCRNNYKKHLDEYPLNDNVLSDRNNLFKWLVDVHNLADRKTKKTYDETFNYYTEKFSGNEHFENIKKIDNKRAKIVKIMMLIGLLLIIICLHKIYKKVIYVKKK